MSVAQELKTPKRFMTASVSLLGLASIFSISQGNPIFFIDKPTPSLPDMCTSNNFCEGVEMKMAMRENGTGDLSFNSPIGRALTEIGDKHGVSKYALMDIMSQMDLSYNHSKDMPTYFEADGITFIRPPQYKKDPDAPFSISNPFMKPDYFPVIMVSKLDSGTCHSYTIKSDGSYELYVSPDQLLRNVGSHSGPMADGCKDKGKLIMKKMGLNLV